MTPEPIRVREITESQLDAIDAAVFSGDTFHTPEGIARLRWFMDRWERACEKRERSLEV